MKLENGRVILDDTDILYYVDWCGFRPVPENSVDFITIGRTRYTKQSFTEIVEEKAKCGCYQCMGVLIDRLTKCVHATGTRDNKWGVRAMTNHYLPEINAWIESAQTLRIQSTAECIRRK